MATLTVWKFNTADGADKALTKLADLQKQQLIEIQDAAIVSWAYGRKKPKTRQALDLVGVGAIDGAFWGILFGIIFLTPVVGMIMGAALGALSGSFGDYGINDDFIQHIKSKVTEGTSALFLLTGEVTIVANQSSTDAVHRKLDSMFLTNQISSKLARKIQLFLLGIGSAALVSLPAKAAEKINFQYGPFVRSLEVSSLEAFAETGVVRPDLQFYFDFLKADKEEQQGFRQVLNDRSQVNLVQLSRFFYTSIGEDFLNQFGSYIRTDAGINGKYALRAAILLAASDPQGLSLLNLFRKYPTNMRIDVLSSLSLSKAAGIVVEATKFFTKTVADLSEAEAQNGTATNFSASSDLTQPGSLGVQKRRWQLRDEKRDRSFYVDLYQPQQWRSGQAPVIVISHGLASRPEDFAQRAEYLASYGYVVAVPQHPGSDTLQAQNMKQGLSREVFLTQEFIDRPLDITYVLDELDRRNQTEFSGRLNVQSVGVMGHSLGGYTALALAGATIDFANLQQACNNNLEYLDLSLFIQCQVLKLPRETYNFQDRRVKAVYALNPVNNSIFGANGLSQITIPTMLEAGTYDLATPAVFEQVRSFNMLTTPNKYLALLEGQAHVDFSNLNSGLKELIESMSYLTLPSPNLLNGYSNALTLAFFEVSLLDNETYRPYLQAAYTEYLSRDQQFKVFLIGAASDEGLERASQVFRSKL